MAIKEDESMPEVENVERLEEKLGVQSDEAAAQGTQVEKELTVRQAFKYYRKAAIWCLIISLGTIMESYDLQIIASFYAYPTFQQKFGEMLANGTYSVPANWQLGLSLGSNTGLIFGTFANGYFADRYGPRKVMMTSFVVLTGFIFITFFAPTVEVLFVGELLW